MNLGTPLGAGKEITAIGSSDTNTGMGGYTILQAEDLAGAEALLEGHPHLMMPDASIQVYETLDLPGT